MGKSHKEQVQILYRPWAKLVVLFLLLSLRPAWKISSDELMEIVDCYKSREIALALVGLVFSWFCSS